MDDIGKPLYRYPPKQREDSARMFIGKPVTVIEHPGRWVSHARVLAGTLVSVATSPTDNGSSIIVLSIKDEPLHTAVSLANVARIYRSGN